MQDATTSDPVTVVISRRVRDGQERLFEELSGRMTEAASSFPGHLGAVMFRPGSREDPEYRIVFKFNSQKNLNLWLASEIRQEWLRNIEELLEQPSEVETISGLVTWFTLPGCNPVQPPPRYKMTAVSWLALFPTVTLIFWLFEDWLAPLPLMLRTGIVTVVVMTIMAYVLMPRFTKWFAFWLFSHRKDSVR